MMLARGWSFSSNRRSRSTRAASSLPTRNTDDAGVTVVLGLRQHLARDELRIAALIDNHEQLARSRRSVDADDSRYLQLRLGHIRIARPDDPVHARNGVRAVRHRSDRSGAADGEHAVDAGDRRSGQHHARKGYPTRSSVASKGRFRERRRSARESPPSARSSDTPRGRRARTLRRGSAGPVGARQRRPAPIRSRSHSPDSRREPGQCCPLRAPLPVAGQGRAFREHAHTTRGTPRARRDQLHPARARVLVARSRRQVSRAGESQ